jgi:predicted RNA binding protein YcfA (HicA-like mRNA interferase family)
MTNQELRKILKKAGCKITGGGKHDMATHESCPGVKAPIPRHKGEIPIGTVNSILKILGLQKPDK